MEEPPLSLFDAHLHPEGITDQDLESLRIFGVTAAIVLAHYSPAQATARALLSYFDEIIRAQLPRLERAGIRGYAALGIDPRCIPHRGLSEVLSALPDYFQGGKVVAVGEVGLQRGGVVEEEALTEQLLLARKLKLPVLVHTPVTDKERITRRVLTILRTAGMPAAQVLVDHANERTARLILECHYTAGLTIHPDELSAENASALVRRMGSERLVLDSDLGDGAGDLLGLPRAANLMSKQKLSKRVVERVCFKNAAEFFRVSAEQLAN
jgi:predicted metal-dependent TIM-barrel fold hydrolase